MPLVVLLAVAAICAYFVLRAPPRPGWRESEQEERLLHLCLGDRALAERLVEAERARAPGISRQQAIDRAHALLSRSKG